MVVSYTNNYGYTDAYANKNINNMTTNGDGGGNGGGGAFFKMFEEQETDDKKSVDKDPKVVEDIMNLSTGYYPNNNIIKDYIDNSLLLNNYQKKCLYIFQHL